MSPDSTVVAHALAIEPLLDVKAILAVLLCSRRTLEQMRSSGRFPKPDKMLGRRPRWKRTTLAAWIARGGAR